MSEPIVEPTPAQEPEHKDETDWKARSREWERRAKENKAAAEKLAELEEAQKSAEQKAAERLAEAERKAAEAEFKVHVATIAGDGGVPVSIAAGPTDRTPEAVKAFVDEVVAWADQRAGARRRGPVVSNEGRAATGNASDPMREFARNLFGSAQND